MKTKIQKVGFEVEGEMDTDLQAELHGDLGGIHDDGSLNKCSSLVSRPNHAELPAVEFASNPVLVKGYSHAVADIFGALGKAYEAKRYHWNSSCGFHVHLSFNQTPIEIWSAEFVRFFLSRFSDKFKKAYKLRSGNKYCKIFTDEDSVAWNDSHYNFINFGTAMSEHGTVEFRIFPGDSPKNLKRYLDFTVDTVQWFINHSGDFLKRQEVINLGSVQKTIREVIAKKVQEVDVSESLETPIDFPQEHNSRIAESIYRGIENFEMWRTHLPYSDIQYLISRGFISQSAYNPDRRVYTLSSSELLVARDYLLREREQRRYVETTRASSPVDFRF